MTNKLFVTVKREPLLCFDKLILNRSFGVFAVNDALELVGEPEVMSEIYYLGNMSITENIVVSIEERKLAFSYESMHGEEHQGRYTIKDVDAIQLQQRLGVDNYRGIVEELKLRFGSHSGYEEFREMLLSNNIEFEEECE